MKKFLSFLLMIAAFLSLGIYSSFADETGVDFHSDSPPFEAAGLVGLMDGNVLRFDDFSFSITAPNQKCADGWGKRTVPETISDLNDSIKASADSNLILLWDDFTAEQGSASLSVSISPCESTATEKDLLSWAKGYFEKADGVSVCEFVTLPLGDMKDQLCLHVSFVYDDNHEEDLLVINKKHGEYCLGCEIRTYGWKGALEEAEQLIFVNAPNELPFAILDSGRLIIKDKTIFGKTAEELGPCFDFFPTPTEFPWWDIPLTCSNMDCDGYIVSLLFDSDDRLYCVMCEEVEKEKFETAFDEAKIDSNDIYYYYLCLNTEFFVDGKNYEFMADDDLTFDFGLCNDQKGGVAISQRYFGEAVTDEKILTFANAILDGTLSDLTPDHAMKLAEFASDRSGDAENMLIVAALYEEELHDNEKALEWYEKAVEMGDADAMFELGSFYIRTNNDAEAALTMYDKAAKLGQPWAKINIGALYAQMEETEELDYDKAAKGLLEEIDSDDESLAVSAKGWLYALYQKEKDRFSADTRAAADEMFIPVEEAAENGSGEAAGQFGDYYRGMRDYAKALEWYEKGAELGDGHSGLFSGRILMGVFGNDQIKTNLNKAAEYLLAASKAKDETVREEAAVHLVEIWYNYRDTLTPELKEPVLNKAAEYLLAASKAKDETVREKAAVLLVDIWYNSLDTLTPELKEPVQAAAVAKVLADKDLFLPDVVMQAERLAG